MIALLLSRHLANPAIAIFALASVTILLVAPNELAPLPLLVFTMIAWRAVPQRVDAFEASLPIRGREIVMARALVAMAFALLPVASWLLLTVARSDREVLPLQVESALLCALAILAPHVLARGAVDGGIARSPVAAWIGLAALAAPVWYFAPALAVPVFAAGVVAAFVVIWETVPDALPLCRPEAEAKDLLFVESSAGPSLRSGRQGVLHPYAALVRSALFWNAWVFWLLLIVAPMFGTEAIFGYFWIAVLNASGIVRQRTSWMATLPMSHRARLLWIAVPAVAVSVGCVALGTAIRPWMPFQRWSLARDGPLPLDGSYLNRTSVSIDHWRRAARGTAPVIAAPWGEEVVADTATVFGVTLYNPFTTVEKSTPRFREWQFERATIEVYGEPVALEAYERGYTPPRHIVGGVHTALVTGAVLLMFGLAIVIVAELGYSHRRRPGSRTTLIVQWGAALLVMAFMATDLAYRVRDGDVMLVLMRGGLVELGARLPANVVLATVMAALPVAAAYALLERQFRRSEPGLVPDRRPR